MGRAMGLETSSFSVAGGWVANRTVAGDGNVAVFTPVPEPSALVLLSLGLAIVSAAVLCRRGSAPS